MNSNLEDRTSQEEWRIKQKEPVCRWQNKKNQNCKSQDQCTSLQTTSTIYHEISTNSNPFSIQKHTCNAPKDSEQNTETRILQYFISTKIHHRKTKLKSKNQRINHKTNNIWKKIQGMRHHILQNFIGREMPIRENITTSQCLEQD